MSLHAAHRHRQDVAAQAAAERGQVVGRIHPGIADEQAAAEPPGAQIVLDAGDRGDVGGVAGQHPGAHRHAVAGDGERDDHLRLVVAPFLAVAAPAQRRVQPAGTFLLVLVRLVDLEIGRGGVVEDQVDIEAEQIGGPEEDVALDLVGPDRQEVERAIALIDREPGRVGQPGDVGQPALGAGQFGDRVVEPVGGHGEQRGLVRRGQIGPFGAGADRSADAEFLPQRAGGEHDAEFEHPLDLDLGDVLGACRRQPRRHRHRARD